MPSCFSTFLLLLCLVPGLVPGLVQGAAPTPAEARRLLGANEVSYLRDPDGSLTIEQLRTEASLARFQPFTPDVKLGFTDDVVWLRITLSGLQQKHTLEITNPYLNDVRFYAATDNGQPVWQAGDRFPLVDRVINYRQPLFPIEPASDGSASAYLRIHSDSTLAANLVLWEPTALLKAIQQELLLFGGLLGMALVAGLFALLNWAWSRERMLRDIAALTLFLLIMIPAQLGYLAQWFLPHSPWLADLAVPWTLAIQTAALCLIFRRPLQSQTDFPRIHRLLAGMALITLLAPLSREFDLYAQIGGPILQVMRMSTVIVLLALSARQWRRGLAGTGQIFAATLIIFVSLALHSLPLIGWLPLFPVLSHLWVPALLAFLLLSQMGMLVEARIIRLRQQEAEQEARRAAALAGQEQLLREEQTVFFSFVAHELRTPLGVIRTGLANLESDLPELADKAHVRLARLRRSTTRMADMIERHLQLQRLANPGFSLHRGPENPLTPLEAAVAQAHQLFPHREFLLAAVPPAPTFPSALRMDADLIELALLNLLSNAAKYSPIDQPVRIEFDSPPQQFAYRIIDAGPGIPAAEQQRLFSIYQRKDSDRAGFGIGLTLAQRIASVHNGSLTYAREDSLTVFSLSLPTSS